MTNWKTTLSGFALAIMYGITNQPDWKHIVTAVMFAAAGLLAKDFNVTGGTVLNTNASPNTPVGTSPKS
jgi:hypothetical protein